MFWWLFKCVRALNSITKVLSTLKTRVLLPVRRIVFVQQLIQRTVESQECFEFIKHSKISTANFLFFKIKILNFS